MENETISKQSYQLIIGILITKLIFTLGNRYGFIFSRSWDFGVNYVKVAIDLSLVISLAYLLSNYFKAKMMYNVKTFYLTRATIVVINIFYYAIATGTDSSISIIMSGLMSIVSIITSIILYSVIAFSPETKEYPYLKYFGLGALIYVLLSQFSFYIFYLYELMNFLEYFWYGLQIIFIIHFIRDMDGMDDDGIIDEFILDN